MTTYPPEDFSKASWEHATRRRVNDSDFVLEYIKEFIDHGMQRSMQISTSYLQVKENETCFLAVYFWGGGQHETSTEIIPSAMKDKILKSAKSVRGSRVGDELFQEHGLYCIEVIGNPAILKKNIKDNDPKKYAKIEAKIKGNGQKPL